MAQTPLQERISECVNKSWIPLFHMLSGRISELIRGDQCVGSLSLERETLSFVGACMSLSLQLGRVSRVTG